MSAEQSLVGAMGLASWRCRDRLGEHAVAAPLGGTIRGSKTPVVARPSVLGLNEVGVTDLVMATLWRHGPNGAAYAVSPGAEANHLGADIAILHPASKRLLVYQAKIAHHEAGTFMLKSPVTHRQLALLNRRSVTLESTRYNVTGRLAIYQADVAPFIRRCDHLRLPRWWYRWQRDPWAFGDWELPAVDRDARRGRHYYEEALVGCACSPSGVLATAAPQASQRLDRVKVASTWPWEFDTHSWLGGLSPLDDGRENRQGQTMDFQEGAPDFESYRPADAEPPTSERAAELAYELGTRIGLPGRQVLHLIVLA